jgi:hypothetical protein
MNAADPPIKTAPAGSQLDFEEVLKTGKAILNFKSTTLNQS